MYIYHQLINSPMIKKILFLHCYLLVSLISLSQTTINLSSAGTLLVLAQQAGVKTDTITQLKLTGNTDARDFKTIRDLMINLEELDISLTDIVYYKGVEGTIGTGDLIYEANQVPYMALAGCQKLKHVSLPQSATSLGALGFDSNTQLVSVTLPDQIKSISYGMFYGCTSLFSVEIPASVKIIGVSAFSGCTSLQSIPFSPNSELISITAFGFQNCSSLSVIQLPQSLTTIDEQAFSNCTGFKEFTISTGIKTLTVDAFRGCKNIERFTVSPENNYFSSSEGVLFNKTKTKLVSYPLGIQNSSYVVPETVDTIGIEAFGTNEIIENISFSSNLKVIDKSAFYGCSNLTTLNFPYALKEIKSFAFSDCVKLSTIRFSESLLTIGESAFRDCSDIQTITLPESLKEISYNAFRNCDGISALTIPANVEIIRQAAFAECNKLLSITVDDNPIFYSMNGILMSGNTLIQYPAGKTGRYDVPTNISSIENYAFLNCIGLDSVLISTDLVRIGKSAFEDCENLVLVKLHEVQLIQDNAFAGCKKLSSIYAKMQTPTVMTFFGVFRSVDKSNCILYVPIEAVELFKKANVWKEFENIVGCEKPEIQYFRIKEIIPNDEWTVDVTFELDAINTEHYRLTQDCYDSGYSYDYDIINNGSDVFTIHNVEKYLTNYFRLFAINSCGEESKATEVVLAPITTDIAPTPSDCIDVKVLAGNMVITNSFDRNLSLKVYSVQGVCLLSEILMPGKNEFSMQQWSNITVIRIDDKGKTLLTKKILSR